jgi:hypothetical protein
MTSRLARRVLAPPFLVSLLSLPLVALVAPRVARADDVRFEANEPGLELWRQTGQVAMIPGLRGRYARMERTVLYASLCSSTPCTVNMGLGTQALALSHPGGPIVPMDGQLNIGGPATVVATYHDLSTTRVLGVVVDLAGAAAGGALFAAAHESGPAYAAPTFNPYLVGLAIVLTVGSVVAGTAMILQSDWATATVRF